MSPAQAPSLVGADAVQESRRRGSVHKTLFLVRHGEALHNVEEKRARSDAEEVAEALGYERGSEDCRACAEAARQHALEDERFADAPLSEAGKAGARAARAEIEAIVEGPLGLKQPTGVYVSPLQRTLQTAALLFPHHPSVHIREYLRERRTGRPCDERQPAAAMAKRASFEHMSFAQLSRLDAETELSLMDSEHKENKHAVVLEDAPMLRDRTLQLAEVLSGVADVSLCLVTHKAYLRELERGPLGRPEANEFRNCEVRVYDIELLQDGGLAATLLHCAGGPLAGAEPCCACAENVALGGADSRHSGPGRGDQQPCGQILSC